MTETDHYERVQQEIDGAIAHASNPTQAMEATVMLLRDRMPKYDWVGIYLLDGNELVLGPYTGRPSRHTRIPLGRGICGAAATEKSTIVVDDVSTDSRYLACSPETRSEIVVPIMDSERVLGEIDVDSDQAAAFGPSDRQLLESVAGLLTGWLLR